MPQRNIHDVLAHGRDRLSTIRARVVSGLTGRSRQAIAIAALAGVTGIGLAAATIDTPNPDQATAVALANHANAANRADRATRDTTPASTKPAPTATTATKKTAKKHPKWVTPMPGARITSCYGMRWGVLHAGIDFAAAPGTPIHAVGAGRVFAAGWTYSGYGISVVIDHGNGFYTHYAHMSKAKVKVGQKVKPGTVLGLEGTTGDSTGPHLHFEVHKGHMWHQINPAGWLAKRGIHTGC